VLKEIWKNVPEWEDFYEVSNFGRARNKKTGKLKPLDVNNYGYSRLQCYNGERRKKLFIHRLVATLFVKLHLLLFGLQDKFDYYRTVL